MQHQKNTEHICALHEKNHISTIQTEIANNPSHCLAFFLLGVLKCAKHPIHPYGVMAIVVPICSVVNGVVASTHNRPHLSMNAVMNICSPNTLKEKES